MHGLSITDYLQQRVVDATITDLDRSVCSQTLKARRVCGIPARAQKKPVARHRASTTLVRYRVVATLVCNWAASVDRTVVDLNRSFVQGWYLLRPIIVFSPAKCALIEIQVKFDPKWIDLRLFATETY